LTGNWCREGWLIILANLKTLLETGETLPLGGASAGN
jgi:hypothetical protein